MNPLVFQFITTVLCIFRALLPFMLMAMTMAGSECWSAIVGVTGSLYVSPSNEKHWRCLGCCWCSRLWNAEFFFFC